MSEKLGLEEDYLSPPYEDANPAPPSFSESKETATRPSLHAQLSQTRTRRIQNLLAMHIEPVLYSHILEGFYRRCFVVIPADVLNQEHNLAAKDIVGLANDGSIIVIRLHDDENRVAFWQQLAVLQELAASLRARLAASGHKVEAVATAAPVEPPQPPVLLDQSQRRQTTSSSWFKKQPSTPEPPHDPTATTDYKLGWRSEKEDLPLRKLGLDEVRVSVQVKDVSFRVETEMGLLDSVTGRVLWLELEIGS